MQIKIYAPRVSALYTNTREISGKVNSAQRTSRSSECIKYFIMFITRLCLLKIGMSIYCPFLCWIKRAARKTPRFLWTEVF